MNKRLKELSEEAWRGVNADHYIEGADPLIFTVDDIIVFEDKFSKLLINECIAICEEHKALYEKSRMESMDFADKNRLVIGENVAGSIAAKIKEKLGL